MHPACDNSDLERLRAPRVQPDGTILLYPDELGLEEGPRPGDLRLTDLIGELRANDPTWANSVARANAYKRSQETYYRRRAECLTGKSAPSIRLGDTIECLCGARVRRIADGSKYDWETGRPHVCGQARPALPQPVRTFASDWQTNPKRLPSPSKQGLPATSGPALVEIEPAFGPNGTTVKPRPVAVSESTPE